MNSLLIPRSKISAFSFFSTFKTKFEKVHSIECQSISQFYMHLQQFENNLSYIEQLKLSKCIPDLTKKAKKLKKKQSSFHSYLATQPFRTSITYTFFYGMDSQIFKPIHDDFRINSHQIDYLYERVVHSPFEQNLSSDFELAYLQILSNPKKNIKLYEELGQRCSHLEDQISLHAFQGFGGLLKSQKNESELVSQDKNMLKKLKDQKGSYTKDFKFMLNQNLGRQKSTKISEIAKNILKYAFESEKIKMLSLKSLSSEGKNLWSPQWLANHLYILAYHKIGVKEINENIYNIYDMIKSKEQDRQQRLPLIQRLSSFLFYILVNKLENIDLFRSLLIRFTKQLPVMRKEELEIFPSTLDRELFLMMAMLLDKKHRINIESIKSEGDVTADEAQLFREQVFSKIIPQIDSDSTFEFEKYLKKKQYIFSKSRIFSSGGQTFSQQIFCIEDRNWVCFNLSKIEKKTSKVNGVGEILLQLFKTSNISIKIINPQVTNNLKKGTEREQYFKSKLKGVSEPDYARERRFDF